MEENPYQAPRECDVPPPAQPPPPRTWGQWLADFVLDTALTVLSELGIWALMLLAILGWILWHFYPRFIPW